MVDLTGNTCLMLYIKVIFGEDGTQTVLLEEAILSEGGRITLLKSMLLSLPTYYLSILTIPTSVMNGLERL